MLSPGTLQGHFLKHPVWDLATWSHQLFLWWRRSSLNKNLTSSFEVFWPSGSSLGQLPSVITSVCLIVSLINSRSLACHRQTRFCFKSNDLIMACLNIIALSAWYRNIESGSVDSSVFEFSHNIGWSVSQVNFADVCLHLKQFILCLV
jgi:hypothetical protein